MPKGAFCKGSSEADELRLMLVQKKIGFNEQPSVIGRRFPTIHGHYTASQIKMGVARVKREAQEAVNILKTNGINGGNENDNNKKMVGILVDCSVHGVVVFLFFVS